MENKQDGHSAPTSGHVARSDTHMPGQDWTSALNSWRRGLKPNGFITNQRGMGFNLHGSTERKVLASLCAYLDKLEGDRAELLEAVQIWMKFFDTMPKGQFGKISCDIGLMNDGFIKSRAAIQKATGGA